MSTVSKISQCKVYVYIWNFEFTSLLLPFFLFFLSSFLPLHPFFLFFLSSFLPFFLFLAFLFSFFPISLLSSSTFCSLFIFCSLPSFSLKYIILEKYNSCRTSELNVFHEDEITGIWKPSLVRISSSLFRLYSLPLSLIPNFLNIVSTPVVPSYLMFSCILVYFPKDFRKRKSPWTKRNKWFIDSKWKTRIRSYYFKNCSRRLNCFC